MQRRPAALIAIGCVIATVAACSPNTATMQVGATTTLRVELAQTAEEQQRGLSGRDSLRPGTGMLFLFGQPSKQQVWMAGMTFAIDIAWIADGQVVGVETLTPCTQPDQTQCPLVDSPQPVHALLETPQGSLAAVQLGDRVAVEDSA